MANLKKGQRDLLKLNQTHLVKSIQGRIDDVTTMLCDQGVITEQQKNQVLFQKIASPTVKANFLFEKILPGITRDGFNALYEIFRKCQLEEAATVLKPQVDERSVMVSYNWGNKDVARKIADTLKKRGYNIWIDTHDMHGHITDSMAEAVDGATVVIVCMSTQYFKSKNCKSEAEYAHNEGKIIIPVLVEPDYKAKGWLGVIIGTKLFYNFSGESPGSSPFEEKMAELEKALQKEGCHPKSLSGDHSIEKGIQKLTLKDSFDGKHQNPEQSLQTLTIKEKVPEQKFCFNWTVDGVGSESDKHILKFSDCWDIGLAAIDVRGCVWFYRDGRLIVLLETRRRPGCRVAKVTTFKLWVKLLSADGTGEGSTLCDREEVKSAKGKKRGWWEMWHSMSKHDRLSRDDLTQRAVITPDNTIAIQYDFLV